MIVPSQERRGSEMPPSAAEKQAADSEPSRRSCARPAADFRFDFVAPAFESAETAVSEMSEGLPEWRSRH